MLNHSRPPVYASHFTVNFSSFSAGSGSNFRGWRCQEVELTLRQEQQQLATARQAVVAHVRLILHRVLR